MLGCFRDRVETVVRRRKDFKVKWSSCQTASPSVKMFRVPFNAIKMAKATFKGPTSTVEKYQVAHQKTGRGLCGAGNYRQN